MDYLPIFQFLAVWAVRAVMYYYLMVLSGGPPFNICTVCPTDIGPILDLISLSTINISEPRFESYDPWDMAY